MGLGAVVPCNCLVRGVATPAPVAVHLGSDGWLVPVEDGDWDAFDAWRRSACAHAEMEHTHAHIGNWSMYRSFRQALGEAGWAHFPTLQRVLPDSNEGSVGPLDARACMFELKEFRRVYRHERPILVDARSGEVVCDHDEAQDGIFLHGGSAPTGAGVDFGFDRDGFFIVPSGTRAVLFQALRVEQRPDASGGTEFVDLDTGRSWVSSPRLTGPAAAGLTSHQRLEVQRRVYTAEDHEDVVAALEAAFGAAVEVGSPVLWT